MSINKIDDLVTKVELNREAKHTHANKEILDNTTASFTIQDKENIANNASDIAAIQTNYATREYVESLIITALNTEV